MEDKLEFRMDPQETEADDDRTILSEKDMNDLDNVELDMDDLKTEEDAFSNLRSDGRMSNVIHADGDFRINSEILILDKPIMIITATDGAFDYLSSPMEFEHVLLSTLLEADSPAGWEKLLSEAISPVTGDDFAICASLYGFMHFGDCKKYYKERFEYLTEKYMNMILVLLIK